MRAEWQHKRPRILSRCFAVQPIPRDLGRCAPVPGSRQVSWLKAQRLPPLPGSKPSDRCKCTLAAGSLITVTRSCGICTRFPFTLPAGDEAPAQAPAVFYSDEVKYITLRPKMQYLSPPAARPRPYPALRALRCAPPSAFSRHRRSFRASADPAPRQKPSSVL